MSERGKVIMILCIVIASAVAGVVAVMTENWLSLIFCIVGAVFGIQWLREQSRGHGR